MLACSLIIVGILVTAMAFVPPAASAGDLGPGFSLRGSSDDTDFGGEIVKRIHGSCGVLQNPSRGESSVRPQ